MRLPEGRRRARLQLLGIAAIFAAPVLLAWLFTSGVWFWKAPATHAGELLQPPLSMQDYLPGEAWQSAPGLWRLLVLGTPACGPACEQSLHTLTRLKLGLGRRAQRVSSLYLGVREASGPADHQEVVAAEPLEALNRGLAQRLGRVLEPGAVLLLDWRGQLMMAYGADAGPAPIAKDLKRLFKTFRID